MPKALFFPSYHGGGFGHVSRCLALAEILREARWESAFCLGGSHAQRLASKGWQVFQPPWAQRTITKRALTWMWQQFQRPPAYLFFSDLGFQAVRDGFHESDTVLERLGWTREVVRAYRPSVLIGDLHLLTWALGALYSLPVVQIARSATYPENPALVWWRAVPSEVQSPDLRPVFNPAFDQLGLPPIQETEDLLAADLILIPSIPEVDPVPEASPTTRYVGPLIQKSAGVSPPDWIQELSSRERPLVYVTVGGGSDSSQQRDLLRLWTEAFAEAPWNVVISTGGRSVPRRLRSKGNLQVFSWISAGRLVIERADVVLFHGGYGTMMETVQAGTPSVVFPFHTEQESNGRRLEQLGIAEVVAPVDASFRPNHFTWRDQALTTFVVPRLTRSADQVRQAVDKVLAEEQYAEHANRVRALQAEYNTQRLVLEALDTVL
jgi:UDP:flavonoid glycosyltransferase YjiC (YdhE family)